MTQEIRLRIKDGWGEAGREGIRLGPDIFCLQNWTPVLWDGEEDPTFHKSDGLEEFCNHMIGIQEEEHGDKSIWFMTDYLARFKSKEFLSGEGDYKFIVCPLCGNKIDWEIKENLKDGTKIS